MRSAMSVMVTALAVPALAQDAPRDWDLHRDNRAKTLMAYTQFTNGLGVGFRCIDGVFAAVVSGLPETEEEQRTLGLKFGDEDAYDSRWTSTTNSSTAVADLPAPLARNFRKGGSLRLTVPGAAEGGRNLTYAVDLPASSAAIDETLTRCQKPLVDPRDVELNALPDDGLPVEVRWARQPMMRYPSTNYGRGYAVISCIAGSDGQARDCVVESEHPHDGRFGRAALRAMDDARLSNRADPNAPLRPSQFTFRANFVMHGYETGEDRQRMRESRQREREGRTRDQAGK